MSESASVGRDQKANDPDDEIKEQHSKLMQSFQSILTAEVWFMFSTMAGASNLDRLAKGDQAHVVMAFIMMGYVSIVSWIISHTTEASKWSGVVSGLTQVVTILCLGLFHFVVGLLIPEEYPAYMWTNFLLFIAGGLSVLSLWRTYFLLPKSKTVLKED